MFENVQAFSEIKKTRGKGYYLPKMNKKENAPRLIIHRSKA